MKNVTYILFLAIILFLFPRCENRFSNVIELDIPDHEPTLVAYSFIDENASKIIVDVSQSKGVLEQIDDFHIGTDNIKILKNGEPFIDDFEETMIFSYINYDNYPDEDSVFRPVMQAESLGFDDKNATYSLEVVAEEFKTITSDITIPKIVEVMDAIYTKEGFLDSDGWRLDEVKVKLSDPANVENYYMVVLLEVVQAGEIIDTTEMWSFTNDSNVRNSGSYIIPGINDFAYFSDKNFEGHDFVLSLATELNWDETQNVENILVRLYSISKDLYNFVKSYNLYRETHGSPFSEPVIVNSNIVNGYGLFSIYGYDEFVIEVD